MRRAPVMAIARAEVVLQLRDGRARIAVLIVAALFALSMMIGWRQHVALAKAVDDAQATTQTQFVRQGRKNPHLGAHYGMFAYRPETPLSFFDPGVDDVTGIAVFVEPHEPHRFLDAPAQDETSLARFGSWSAASLAQILLPLLVLLLAAPSIARERERGTLRVLLAQGVSGPELCIGKALGIGITLLLTLLPGVLGLVICASTLHGNTAPSWGRASFLMIGYTLYILAFLFAGLAISARAKNVSWALVIALTLWTTTTIVVPRVGAEIANAVFPAPSAFDLQNDLMHTTWVNDLSAWDAHTTQITEREMKHYGVSRKEDLPVNVAGLALQAQETEDAPQYDRVYESLFATFAKQERALDVASIVAPMLAMESISTAAAGTDMPHRVDYWWSVEAYRRDLVRVINAYIARTPGDEVTGDAELWKTIPVFSYHQPTTGWALRRVRWTFVVLVFWTLLSVITALLSARLMRVGE